MTEKVISTEGKVEKILNEREILKFIENIVGTDYSVYSQQEDAKGLYTLELQTHDESGDIVQYNYRREGPHFEGGVLDVIFYSNGIPVGGHVIARYKDEMWTME